MIGQSWVICCLQADASASNRLAFASKDVPLKSAITSLALSTSMSQGNKDMPVKLSSTPIICQIPRDSSLTMPRKEPANTPAILPKYHSMLCNSFNITGTHSALHVEIFPDGPETFIYLVACGFGFYPNITIKNNATYMKVVRKDTSKNI